MAFDLTNFSSGFDLNDNSSDLKSLQGILSLDSHDDTKSLSSMDNCDGENEPQVVFAAVMVALVVIGLVGNSLVFFTIMVLKEYRKSVTNWYILQLTIADSLFLFMLPFTAHSEITGYWDFSVELCKAKESIIFINYYASIYFLVVMSFDRYLAVTKAFASNQWVSSLRSPNASYVISIVGWVLSVILCIQIYRYSIISDCQICEYTFPQNPAYDYLDCAENETSIWCLKELDSKYFPPQSESSEDSSTFEPFTDFPDLSGHQAIALGDLLDKLVPVLNNNSTNNETFKELSFLDRLVNQIPNCKLPDSTELHIWIYGNFVGAFLLPFFFICFFYGMIMITIRRASVIGDNTRQRSYRRRVTLIVLALVALFVVSWLPWYAEKLAKIRGFHLAHDNCVLLSNAVRGIAYLNSAFNPYFYSFLGVHFRERLKRASRSVRLPSSIRTRPSVVTSLRRRKYSTSNSQGSNRNNQNAPPQSAVENKNVNSKIDDIKGSTAVKTERTVV